jgi:hypothetical protein
MMMLGVAAMALTACNNQAEIGEIAENETTPVEIEFTGTIADDAKTRVSDTSWDKGDSIGVFIDSIAFNNKYVTADGDGVFTADTIRYIKGSDTHKVYAYYPYFSSCEEGVIKDLSTSANPEDQKINDIMVAEASVSKYDSKVKLDFKRKMAKLVINIRTSTADGLNADDVFGNVEGSSITQSYGQLTNTYSKVLINSKGQVMGTGSSTSSLRLKDGVQDTKNHVLQYTIIIPSQFNQLLYKHTLGNNTLNIALETDEFEFEEGYTYTYNITIKKSSMVVSSSTIEAWKDMPPISNTYCISD